MTGGDLGKASFPESFHSLTLFESEWRVEAEEGTIRLDAVNVQLDYGGEEFVMFRGGESDNVDLIHGEGIDHFTSID
jgi:hypothetical protein